MTGYCAAGLHLNLLSVANRGRVDSVGAKKGCDYLPK